MLFVELALIRWSGSNIVYLSYFSNFVLLGSFLGIGVGFLRATARVNLFPYAPIALALFVAFALLLPVEIDRSGEELIYFGTYATTGLPPWLTLPIVFLSVAALMAMIAEGVARQFVEFESLEAYRLDIAGSLAGHCRLLAGLVPLGATFPVGHRQPRSCSSSCSRNAGPCSSWHWRSCSSCWAASRSNLRGRGRPTTRSRRSPQPTTRTSRTSTSTACPTRR